MTVLAYPDPNKEYLLETDASKFGLEAVLSQRQSDGRYHPLTFGSQALRGVEHKYHSTRLEFLAMKWGTHHFETYLLGRQYVTLAKTKLIQTSFCITALKEIPHGGIGV